MALELPRFVKQGMATDSTTLSCSTSSSNDRLSRVIIRHVTLGFIKQYIMDLNLHIGTMPSDLYDERQYKALNPHISSIQNHLAAP